MWVGEWVWSVGASWDISISSRGVQGGWRSALGSETACRRTAVQMQWVAAVSEQTS